MLSHLDSIIFPDRCEVIEIIPSQRYVYPIFKNGYSTLRYHYAQENKCKIFLNEQIKNLAEVEVIIREPGSRFISGMNTFIHMTVKDNPDLDMHTVSWFAKNYLFLNRHYAPQFHWIVNLARYLGPKGKIKFLGMESINQITSLQAKPDHVPVADPDFTAEMQALTSNEMHMRLDAVLYSCIGQSMNFCDLVALVKKQDAEAYAQIVGRSSKILEPIHALPQT